MLASSRTTARRTVSDFPRFLVSSYASFKMIWLSMFFAPSSGRVER